MYILTSKYFPLDYWPDDYFPALPDVAVDIQYTEVMEFTLAIAAAAEFDVVLPNDGSEDVTDTSTMVVSGAGSSVVNGTYTEYGTLNEKKRYKKSGTPNCYIVWDGISRWYISGVGEDGVTRIQILAAAYYLGDNTDTPDLTTFWLVINGVLPSPTVTAPIVPTLTEVAAFTLEMPTVIEIEVYEELSL